MADEPKPKGTLYKLGRRLAQLETKLAAAEKARDEATARATEAEKRPTPEALQKQVDTLSQEKRERLHSDAFAKEAKAAGISPEKVADAFALAGIDTTGEAPDAEAIRAKLTEFVKARPYFKGEAAPAEPEKALGAGQGAGRGADASRDLAGKVVITAAQANDAKFMHDNRAKITEAAGRGAIEYVD